MFFYPSNIETNALVILFETMHLRFQVVFRLLIEIFLV